MTEEAHNVNDCEGCSGSPVPGTIPAMDTPEGIQRCDTCQIFPGDLDAAQALAATIPGGVVRYWQPVDDRNNRVETFTGSYDGVQIANDTNPWVAVNGEPVDWRTRWTEVR